MTGIKQEAISTVNRLIKQVDSLKSGVSLSNNDLLVIVQTSYSNLFRNVEHSYSTFCGKGEKTCLPYYSLRQGELQCTLAPQKQGELQSSHIVSIRKQPTQSRHTLIDKTKSSRLSNQILKQNQVIKKGKNSESSQGLEVY
ncbi:hypothetical protein H5410_037192 [Solanum commersonii]|uniref:Uncharacterized protein n=1 Tax=Solanum commersonii TaxID=4109 RepID=A0A9J5Y8T3_SOLCO|nr:hypothetical protein H5410_037192 [Solanum commersonii]